MAPECIGYDENVLGDRASQSEATRLSGRMPHILAVNPARIKERRAGFLEGDPMFCVVAGGFLGVPLEHPIMYILNSGEEASVPAESGYRRAAEHVLMLDIRPAPFLDVGVDRVIMYV